MFTKTDVTLKSKMTVKQAAELMNVSQQYIRIGLQTGRVYQAISPPTDAGLGVFGQIGTSGYYAGNSLVKMKLYELIGYDKVSGEEIYHAVPVLDSQGTPCLYDKVSGRFEYDMVGQEAFNYAV